MAGRENWALALTVCVVVLLGVNADIQKKASVGRLFVHELEREAFQHEFEPYHKHYVGERGRAYNDPMVFKCNKQQFPDLPRWLRYTQRHPYDSGFLYGTPLESDLGKNSIEIYVTNKRSYETFKERLVISVGDAEKATPYQAEFFIEKREIEKVLPLSVQEEIKHDIRQMWGTDTLEYVNITSALDRGGRVPLPLPGHYEGVYVKLGSDRPYSQCLLRLQTPEHQRECEAGGRITGDCSVFTIPANHVTWCKSTLIDLSRPVPPAPVPTMGSGILEWGGEFNPPDSPPEREFLPDYIVTVIVPFALALLLCLLLVYVMCCRREGLPKRDAMTPELQLYHHHTIQGNSNELRSMADSRANAPQPLSTLPMFNARTGQTAPPQYPSDSVHIPLIMAQQEPNVDTLPRK